jgi:predicted acetyltransferase
VEIELVPPASLTGPVLGRLVELYRYDASEFNGADVDQHGEFGYRYLDQYWTEDDRAAFLLRVHGHWAGFALVRHTAPFDMAEFFVMRKYRRQGVGRRAASELFLRFPGPWQVRQQQANSPATSFWRSVIPYPFKERRTSEEVVQEFDSAP